jgi:hypothetical protein
MTIKWVNTLWGPEIQEDDKCIVPFCKNRKDNSGYGRSHKYCSHHHALKYEMKNYNYKKFRKDYCENQDGKLGWNCNSEILFPLWQLSVDHFDGNNENNDPSNLLTLCHNCHSIKTNIFKNNMRKENRPTEDEINLRIRYFLKNEKQMSLFD